VSDLDIPWSAGGAARATVATLASGVRDSIAFFETRWKAGKVM
jgi:hypothetical protein